MARARAFHFAWSYYAGLLKNEYLLMVSSVAKSTARKHNPNSWNSLSCPKFFLFFCFCLTDKKRGDENNFVEATKRQEVLINNRIIEIDVQPRVFGLCPGRTTHVAQRQTLIHLRFESWRIMPALLILF